MVSFQIRVFGNETKVVSELNFSWGTDSSSRWDETLNEGWLEQRSASVNSSCTQEDYIDTFFNEEYKIRMI